MGAYQLTASGIVIRTSDGANIPNDPRNTDRAAYEVWLGLGNTPDVAANAPLPVKSVQRVGAVRFAITAGVVTSTDDTVGISSIGRLTAGRYRIFYASPDAEVSYLPDAPVLRDAAAVQGRISARTATYTEIRCVNSSNVGVDPAEVIVKFDKVS